MPSTFNARARTFESSLTSSQPPPCRQRVLPFSGRVSSPRRVCALRVSSTLTRGFTSAPLPAHLPSVAALVDGAATLKAIYSRSEKSASDLAQAAHEKLGYLPSVYYDGDAATSLDALLARADIDAVLVVLPITLQPSIVLKALAAGKHVLSEKPVAPDVESGRKLIAEYNATYKPKGLVWRVAENWELEPGYHAAAKAIRDGKIGKVNSFNVRVVGYVAKDSKYYKTPWRTVPDVSRSVTISVCVPS